MPVKAKREAAVRERIQDIGEDTFPDDEVDWKVLHIRHSGDYCFAEVEAEPATVGYPRFIFVVHFDGFGHMQECGCYCMADGQWTLLTTTPGTPSDWKKIPPAG